MPVSSCPSSGQFDLFLSGQLSAADADEIEQHIMDCDACLQRVSGIDLEARKSISSSGADPARAQRLERLIRLIKRLQGPAKSVAQDTLKPHTQGSPEDSSLQLAREATLALARRDTMDGGSSQTGIRRFAFLSAAQGPGELGRIAHYRVVAVLGEGGMGIVFQAEDTQLQRPVALKVLLPEVLARDPDSRQRFLREARATAAVKNEHIITIYAVAGDADVPFLAMELLQGQPLDKVMRSQPHIPLEEVLRIGREIADGLSAAHERGLIHRDIKPANVWLEGAKGRVKILDFGLARDQRNDTHLTHTGMVLGTPSYMSPEQASSEKADHRSDLFSLGCILYRMATGRVPFQGDSVFAVLTALAVEIPPPAVTVNPLIPPALNALIMRLLEKDREARPDSAQAVSAALQAIQENRLAPPPAPRPAAPKPSPAAKSFPPPGPMIPPAPPVEKAERVPSRPAPPVPPMTPSVPPAPARPRGKFGVLMIGLLLLVGAGAAAWYFVIRPMSVATGPTSSPTTAVKDPVVTGRPPLLVTRNRFHPKINDPNTFPSVARALARAQKGDRIVLADKEYDERAVLDGSTDSLPPDVTLESGNGGGQPTLWRLPGDVEDRAPLLTLKGVPGLRIKGIIFEGEGRSDHLIAIEGSCPGLALEDIECRGFLRSAVRLSDCRGATASPLTLRRLRTIAEKPDVPAALNFNGAKESSLAAQHIRVSDCRFEGRTQAAVVFNGGVKDVQFERNRFYQARVAFDIGKGATSLGLALENNTFYDVGTFCELSMLPDGEVKAARNLFGKTPALINAPAETSEEKVRALFAGWQDNVFDRDSAASGASGLPVKRLEFTLPTDTTEDRQFLRYAVTNILGRTAAGERPVGVPPE